eukprot:s794_g1.t1
MSVALWKVCCGSIAGIAGGGRGHSPSWVCRNMTDFEPNSFAVSAIGRQANSKKETCPAFSIGTAGYNGSGYREVQAMKVFLSRKLTHRVQQGRTAPGPIYDIGRMSHRGPAFAFPQEILAFVWWGSGSIDG